MAKKIAFILLKGPIVNAVEETILAGGPTVTPIWRYSSPPWTRSAVTSLSDVPKAMITRKLGKAALETHHEHHHFEVFHNRTLHISRLARSWFCCIPLWDAPSDPGGKSWIQVWVMKQHSFEAPWMSCQWRNGTRWGYRRFLLPRIDRLLCDNWLTN